MSTPAEAVFDTHTAVRKLTVTGFPEPQAEAIVGTVREALGEQVATKADFARLEETTKADFARLEAAIARLEETTKADFARLEETTKADFARLEETTKADFARLEETTKAAVDTAVAKLRSEIYRAMYRMGMGTIIALTAIVSVGIAVAAFVVR